MSRFSPLDLAVASLSVVLLAALGLVLWRGDQVGVSILGFAPAERGLAAASAPVWIAFGDAMDTQSVESRLTIEPKVEGKLIWRGNVIYFLPQQSLTPGETYILRLAAGAQTEFGHLLAEDLTWSFGVREAGVVFLRDTGGHAELWALHSLGGSPRQLTETDGVFDFAVSVDGEQILYSLFNNLSGIDLWLVDREGRSNRLLLDCGADRCYAADWSVDGRIAYSRAPGPLNPGEGYGAPRTWLLDPNTGETVRLHADTQKIGYGPSWSPDAGRLAYFDGVQSRIVVVDMLSGQETHLPSRVGVVGSWTWDGGQMLYYDTLLVEGQALNAVFRVDFVTQDILPFFDPQPQDGDYSNPVLSPDGEWVALRVRPAAGGVADQIWVTPMDGRFALTADDTAASLFADLSWDPGSQYLLYHRMQLGAADPAPEVWIWDRLSAQNRLLARDASAPAWLP
ncbi:MAG: hypothetical protein KIS85_08490 [Anaerolineales bacterium]|nr:hypothetical protein [Anaerolineales bacterium]